MKYVFTLLIVFFTFHCFAQHPNHKVWVFGVNAGLDFNTQPPTPMTTAMNGWESYASQCDEQGNLLFYTNGEQIFDKNHNEMPNADSLMGNPSGSSSQGVQVLPHPANVNQYILLSLDSEESYTQAPNTRGRLYYSVVDMSLNGGLGDVPAGQKNIVIDSLFSEHMMIVGNECKMWLVTHTARGPNFRCYEITEQGLNTTPVVSSSGLSGSTFKYIRGEIAYDPVHKHIFLSTPDSTYATGVLEMHDFDMATGTVSNPRLLGSNDIYYRLCVSPGATKLYATGVTSVQCVLDQFDITLSNTQDIINSKYTIYNSGLAFMQDMAVAPDGMIYGTPSSSATSLFRIQDPDAAGLACNFTYNAINLAPSTYSNSGLPSPCVRRFVGNSQDTHNSHDTTICNAQMTLVAPDNSYDQYLWSTGDTGTSIFVTQPGTYWLTAVSDCKTRTDTFNVADFELLPQVHDTVVCFSSSAVLTAPVTLPDYLWSDGSTGSQITVTQPGTYWVFATDFCIETVDTFHVSFADFDVQLPEDTSICDAISIMPDVDVDGATYTWQDGSHHDSYTVNTSGTYWVEVNKEGCVRADTMMIAYKGFAIDLGNDTTLCENASITLSIDAGNDYLWQDGSIGDKYIVTTGGTYSVRVSNETCSSNDSIVVAYEKCNCVFGVPSVFTPNGDGKNDLFAPVIEATCPVSEYTFYIYNRWGEQVFNSSSRTGKWDGRYKGQLADVGTYMYLLQFKGAKDKMFTQKGDVTLVR